MRRIGVLLVNLTAQTALATLLVGTLSDIETIWAEPVSETCVSFMPSDLSSDTLSNFLDDVEMNLAGCLVGSAPGIMCMCKEPGGDDNGMAVPGARRREAKRSSIGIGGDESM